MKKLFFFGLIAWFFLLTSCKDKMICSAFQSSFILDDEEREKMFSYFGEDSLPKGDFLVSKDKYGLIKKVGYRKKIREMRRIDMITIFPQPEEPNDSTLIAGEYSFLNADSVLREAANIEPADGYGYLRNYNVDQENYLELLGEFLPKPPQEKEELVSDEIINGEKEVDMFDTLSTEGMSKKEIKRLKKQRKKILKQRKRDKKAAADSLQAGQDEPSEGYSKKDIKRMRKAEKKRSKKEKSKKRKSKSDAKPQNGGTPPPDDQEDDDGF